MIDIKTLEMGLSENMNAILDGKSAGDSVDVTDTFVTQSIINHPKSKNLKKLNSKDEATELLEDVLWTIQESKNISKITDLENKPTRTQIINRIKSNKKNIGVHEQMNNILEQMLEGKIDEFSGQVLTESIIQSDENIFYNKKSFIDGDINLCFIVGLSGSGMSRMASEMSKDSEVIEKYDLKDIIHNKGTHDADYYRDKGYLAYSFFSGPGKRFYLKPDEIKHMLNLSEDQYREQLTNAFVDYAVRYANSHKDTKFIIEGVYLHRYINPSRFRDYAVCVLGTSIAKSMYNSDKSAKEKLKSTFQYAGDDLKLNKFKDMYKDKQSDDTEEDSGFDDEYEYENSILLSTDSTMHEYAMNLYTENNLYNSINLSLLLEDDNNQQSSESGTNPQSGTTSQSPVNNNDRVQPPSPQVDPTKAKQQDENKVKKAWDWILSMGTKVVEYIKSLFTKSNQNVENIVAQNLQWIQSNEQIIRDPSNWSETITIQFNGDYQEGLNRFQNTATPAFLENDQFKQALDKDNMGDAIKAVTSGWQGFNYDANNRLSRSHIRFSFRFILQLNFQFTFSL